MTKFNCTNRKVITLYVLSSPIPNIQRSLRKTPVEFGRSEILQLKVVVVKSCRRDHRSTISEGEKLMSHLFTSSEQTSSKSVLNHLRKKQRNRVAILDYIPSSLPAPMKSEWSEDNLEDSRTTKFTVCIGFINFKI